MEFTHNEIDLQKCLARGDDLATLSDKVPRKPGETWLVVRAPVHDLTAEINWGRSLRGDVVPVPLIPYAMPTELDISLGFMVQIGARLVGTIDAWVARLHLAIGRPATEEQLPNNGGPYWRYYLGFAVLLEK